MPAKTSKTPAKTPSKTPEKEIKKKRTITCRSLNGFDTEDIRSAIAYMVKQHLIPDRPEFGSISKATREILLKYCMPWAMANLYVEVVRQRELREQNAPVLTERQQKIQTRLEKHSSKNVIEAIKNLNDKYTPKPKKTAEQKEAEKKAQKNGEKIEKQPRYIEIEGLHNFKKDRLVIAVCQHEKAREIYKEVKRLAEEQEEVRKQLKEEKEKKKQADHASDSESDEEDQKPAKKRKA